MILTRDEFFDAINKRVGENTDDESLKFIEDMTDTYNSLETDRNSDDWERKYKDLDAEWRERYRRRFFEGKEDIVDENREDVKDESEPSTFDELFEEREE